MLTRIRCWFIMRCDKGCEIEAMQSVIKIKKRAVLKEIKTLEKNRSNYKGCNINFNRGIQRRIRRANERLGIIVENEVKFKAMQRINKVIIEKAYDVIK